jgi:hypothetical protein
MAVSSLVVQLILTIAIIRFGIIRLICMALVNHGLSLITYDPGIDMKGMMCFGGAYRLAQQIDFTDQQIAFGVAQFDDEKVNGAWNAGASVTGHGGSSLSGGGV